MITITRPLVGLAAAAALTAGLGTVAAAPAEATVNHVHMANKERADLLRQRVVDVALSKLHHRYITGATGPGAFDCSGLVVYTYHRVAGITLPRTSYAQASAVHHVSRANRKIGDLVFLHNRGHVAIYIGHNRVISASTPSRGVVIATLSGWYGHEVDGYGRVIVT